MCGLNTDVCFSFSFPYTRVTGAIVVTRGINANVVTFCGEVSASNVKLHLKRRKKKLHLSLETFPTIRSNDPIFYKVYYTHT